MKGSRRLTAFRVAYPAAWLLGGLVVLAWLWLFFWACLDAPAPSTVLLDRHSEFLGEISGSEVGGSDRTGQGYWPLPQFPRRVVAATLAAEDRRFWSHAGVDPLAVGRALWQNLQHGARVSGASTLAMQVARLQNPGPRSYPRKAIEALTALALTARYGREAVLAHYLRIAPYGNQVHGIAAAARRYFAKPVEDLSWAEVALLVAIPQAPSRMNPLHAEGRRQAIHRGEWILARLREEGWLSQAEHELAMAQLRTIQPLPRTRRPPAVMHALLTLKEQLARDPAAGRVVMTTLDVKLQREVTRLARETVREWEGKGAANAAVMVIDLAGREVLASVGSIDYFDARRAGAIDYTRVSRSPGSTLKPFIYALALERGAITPATVLDDLPSAGAGIQNADGRFLGPLLPRVALANSRNVPAVDLLQHVGLGTSYAFLQELGLHRGISPPHRYGLSLAVGGLPVSLERLAGAYTALARDGRLGGLVWYRGEPTAPERQVLSEDTARRIALMLSDPQARLPTFPRMGSLEYPFPVAVKTGTSSFWHDAWALAWSRRYLVVAWLGRPDGRAMEGLSGYASAGLAQKVLRRLHPRETEGLEEVGFPLPRGSHPVRLCALTGKLATPACDHVVIEHFAPGTEPVEPCRAHQMLAVDGRNGLLASAGTPAAYVQVRRFVDLAPRYAEWQAAHGLLPPPTLVSTLDENSGARGRMPQASRLRPVAAKTARVRITAPRPGLKIIRDPESPPSAGSLTLSAAVDPAVDQVIWYVDGKPFRVADWPYTVRWPIEAGVHTIQARLLYAESASEAVKLTVH